DCWMTSSISLSCPAEVWTAVRIVAGLFPSEVLHCRLIVPGVETSNRVSCGHEVPPDREADCRMSPTSVPSVYAPVVAIVTCNINIHMIATVIILVIGLSPAGARSRQRCVLETVPPAFAGFPPRETI